MSNELSRRQVLGGIAAVGAASVLGGGAPAALGQEAKKVNVALLGCAHIHTPSFANTLKRRQDFAVKYVYDHDAARAKRYVDMFGAKGVARPEEALGDAELGAVVICSETNRHPELVMAAAAAKKPMFVEKPLGIDAKGSLAMAEAIEKAGVPFQTGYFMRSSPLNIFLKEQVAAGNFGKITKVYASNCHSGSLGGWFDKEWRWMADPKQAGVGGFGDLGTHSLDILMWLLGDIDSVSAKVQVVTNRYEGCDESGQASIQFKNGALGTLVAGWVDVANPVQIMISGTEGHATVFRDRMYFKSNKVRGSNDSRPLEQLPAGKPHAFDLFLDKLVGKEATLVTPAEAAARVVAMEAMYKASEQGGWVKV